MTSKPAPPRSHFLRVFGTKTQRLREAHEAKIEASMPPEDTSSPAVVTETRHTEEFEPAPLDGFTRRVLGWPESYKPARYRVVESWDFERPE